MTAILNRDVLMAAHAVAINGAFVDSTVIKMMRGEQATEEMVQSYKDLADYVEKMQEALKTLDIILPHKQPIDTASDMSANKAQVTVGST